GGGGGEMEDGGGGGECCVDADRHLVVVAVQRLAEAGVGDEVRGGEAQEVRRHLDAVALLGHRAGYIGRRAVCQPTRCPGLHERSPGHTGRASIEQGAALLEEGAARRSVHGRRGGRRRGGCLGTG